MKLGVAAPAALVLLFEMGSAFGQQEVAESSCNVTTYFSVRSAWGAEHEPCHQKISLEQWTFMKAQGSAKDADAQHVYVECMRQPEMGLVELITPKDWNSDVVGAGPGEIIGESENAASLLCKGAEDFEAICADEAVTKAMPVAARTGFTSATARNYRRLQTTTSEAGVAHEVDELIKGLEDLSCGRTRGEYQTICVMSDSFNNQGGAAVLQAFGDLPDVDVVKDVPGGDLTDEGSAMIELAFDIASGANYKFNTAFLGEQTFADDIAVLADAEGCDVIVDDVLYPFEPSYRDGVVASAVDAATQDHDVLFFSSAGNNAHADRFNANWECQPFLLPGAFPEFCGTAAFTAHVFDPFATNEFRYLTSFVSTSPTPLARPHTLLLKWDDDEGSARDIFIAIWGLGPTGRPSLFGIAPAIPGAPATSSIETPGDNKTYFFSIHQKGGMFSAIDLQLVSSAGQIGTIPSGSIFGHACATNALSVAAISYDSASGERGAFADPESSPVEIFSSRGPCFVDEGRGLMERNKPVTTAADGLQTSTPGFNPFFGTSASAPVAAAISALIRAACFPKVVTFSDMMDMLTDYDYTIDATSDAGGATETFGPEAGFGIISPKQMLKWVGKNCPATCPGTGRRA